MSLEEIYECPHCHEEWPGHSISGSHCPDCGWPLDDYPDRAADAADYRNDCEKDERL